MKWLILLFSLIAIDIYLSSLTLMYLGPLLLTSLYTVLLVTGAIILLKRRSALAGYFQKAAGSREGLQRAQKKEKKEKRTPKANQNNTQKMFPLIQVSLAALATFLLFIPGGITSICGIVLATKNTSSLITSKVLKKTVA